jgi:hypothetical protein
MLSQPETVVAVFLRILGHAPGAIQGLADIGAFGNRRKIEDGKEGHGKPAWLKWEDGRVLM